MFKRTVVVATLIGSTAIAADPQETPQQIRQRVLTDTKVAVVTELSEPAAQYKSDGDPSTLEIVFLQKREDGPSRVSDDGEVIFLYRASDRKQQELIQKAFEIRIARESSGT